MGKQVYLDTHNAEELLPDVIKFIKDKVASDSRQKAFDDCTNYWKERIEKVMNDGSPNGAKVSQIRAMFNIPFQDE
jgi:hypothetical protein